MFRHYHGGFLASYLEFRLSYAKTSYSKTYTDDNFRIIGQARSSFHLGVLESVYIKTKNPVLCEQKEFIFSPGLFK